MNTRILWRPQEPRDPDFILDEDWITRVLADQRVELTLPCDA